MVRIIEDTIFEGDKHYIYAAGLSTDTRPSANIVTGSVFLAVDTGTAHFFDEVSGKWDDED